MGQINIHNYEAYLLDLSEGRLTDELHMELELFLIQHPELDINLSDLTPVYLEEDSISFSNKLDLKKSESELVSEERFIAYIEHQLPINEKIELEKSCSINPSLANELALYQKTIAISDTSIVYQNKSELKRKPKVIWFDFSITQYAAAACVLFLIGLFILWPKSETINNSGLTVNSNNNQNTNIKNENPSLVIKEQSSNSSLVEESINPIKKPKSITKSKNTKEIFNNTIVSNNNQTYVSKKDSAVNLAIVQNPKQTTKNETLLALNSTENTKKQNNTIVQVITENDDEPVVLSNDKKKKGIWAAASKALKNLNQVGVKSVNGDENDGKEESSYALTLGGVSITHKAGL